MQETPPAAPPHEEHLISALRAGDEATFASLVERHSPSLLRIAQLFVPTQAVAEEVVQDTWLAVLRGIDRFEGRSTLKTWIHRILTNTAKTRGARERRSVPFSALARGELEAGEPAVEPERFLPSGHEHWPSHWAEPPRSWPEERLLAGETRRLVEEAIERLPPAQRTVITLRDVEGWTSDEVCAALELTEVNQRVLLHRARSKVRAALEDYLI